MTQGILVLNAGSSSIKFALFEGETERHRGAATGIGGAGEIAFDGAAEAADLPDHKAALAAVLARLAAAGITPATLAAAAHRVVHGGPALTAPTRVTPEVIAAIRDAIPLAPLHNPHNLAAIEALAALAPDLAQFASFDTAFHATIPEVARRYALPPKAEALGLRRYGFHGISYAALAQTLPDAGRLLACHLGNGTSLCAIREGRSVATTMGYSPLEGQTMGTRSGSMDPNAVLRMVDAFGLEATRHMLNHEAGLLGLGGAADMRRLEAAGTPEAQFAIDHFCYWAARHAGAMITAMGGLDAIAFTGGIGENSATIRQGILSHLSWIGLVLDPAANSAHKARIDGGGPIAIHVIPAAEERQIAAEARSTGRGD